LKAAGETETTRENVEDWLQLGEGDLGFQLLTEEEIATANFLFPSKLLTFLFFYLFVF
jgi:hypothetical protein